MVPGGLLSGVVLARIGVFQRLTKGSTCDRGQNKIIVSGLSSRWMWYEVSTICVDGSPLVEAMVFLSVPQGSITELAR